MAAVLACGPGAVLSHLAAAHLLGIKKGRAPAPEVTAPTERRVPGLSTHRTRNLPREERTRWKGISTTTIARTLVDLAATLPPQALSKALHEATVLQAMTPARVEAVLARRPSTPGAGELRAILFGDVKVSLSRLEDRFLELLAADGLPLPETNSPASGRRVDCRWPELAVTVELDGYRYHSSRHAWEADRRREREAYARCDEFRRFTYGDVFERARPMLRELRELLRDRYQR